MAKLVRELIEYHGIDTKCDKLWLFSQDNYDCMIIIPIGNPECESIEKVWVNYRILHTEHIKTHKGKSIEGQVITGNSLLIAVDLNIKIQYISSDAKHSIHTIEKTFPFSGIVVLPEILNGSEYITVKVIIEDINSKKINKYTIYNNITLTFVATVY